MSRQLFAAVRTAVFGTLFVALWTYLIPVWLAGPRAFGEARPAGWVVIAMGAAIIIPCFFVFAWRGIGTPLPLDPPRKLVVSGPYRWVRNPMYTGMAIVLLGEAFLFPILTRVLLGELVIGGIAVAILVIGYEEPVLRRKFGEDYLEYCRHVRRWIPRLKPFDNRSNAAVQ